MDTSVNRTAKRKRGPAACSTCRSRKLSCDGQRPCARCQQSSVLCRDEESQDRTPLTRKRMSELEDAVATHHQLWDSLFPTISLASLMETVATGGMEAAVRLAHARMDSSNISASDTPFPRQPDYPATRPLSPHSLAFDTTSVQARASQVGGAPEGNDQHSPLNHLANHSIGPMDGMGATAQQDGHIAGRGGGGYIGLTSGATLLHAIRRLVGQDIFPPTVDSFDLFALLNLPTSSAIIPPERPPPVSLPVTNIIDRLPPAYQTRPLVDSYFKYFHTLTPIVHEPTVRAQISGAIPLTNSPGSRVLVNMVFAMGAFDLGNDEQPEVGCQFHDSARIALQQELLGEGSIQLVQGLAIMANYLQRSNKPNAGYVCLGLAIRMAMAIGIHASAHEEGLTPLETEIRSRLWWGLVTLEAGCCVTFGRPHSLGVNTLDITPMPLNIDEEDLSVSDIVAPPEVERVTLYTAALVQANLAKIIFRLQDRISKSSPSPTVEQIKWCGDRFTEEVALFPDHMQPGTEGPFPFARSVQVWRGRDYESVIYRPVLLAAAWGSTRFSQSSAQTVLHIIEKCRCLALDNLRDIAFLVANNADRNRGVEWYALYFGFQAALTILLSIVWEPAHPAAESWRCAVHSASSWFKQLKSMRKLGSAYAQLLDNFLAAESQRRPPSNLESQDLWNTHLGSGVIDNNSIDFQRYLLDIMSSTRDGPEQDLLNLGGTGIERHHGG